MTHYAFVNCNLIDGVTPGVQSGMTLIIRDGKIEKIGKTSQTEVPTDCKTIDIGGKYVMPGLINAHVHLLGSGKPMKATGSEQAMRRTLRLIHSKLGHALVARMVKSHAADALHSGVTTLRCVGDVHYSDVRLRDLILAGKASGPRLMVSGPIITPTGGHGRTMAIVADSPWEVIRAVRQNIVEQVDLIKICSTGGVSDARKLGEAGRPEMRPEEISAACEEAHQAGLMVASHTQSTQGIREALAAGVDTIEHGAPLDDECIALFLNNPKALRGYSCLIPTLYPALMIGCLDGEVTCMNPVNIQNSELIYKGMIVGMQQAMQAGIKIGLGTDASCPLVTHYATWRELDYIIRHVGVTNEQAIYNATRANAEILGIDDITGTLEAGKCADLIVLEDNPLEAIRALEKPVMIMAGKTFIETPKVKRYPKIDAAIDTVQ